MSISTSLPLPIPLSPHFPENPNLMNQLDIDISDYLLLKDESVNALAMECLKSENQISSKSIENSVTYSTGVETPTSSNMPVKCKSHQLKKGERDMGNRIAFRTKSAIEALDDGYKWRKYGKKKVKNSPNPRNYFRCSSGGCHVKKRIERDSEDNHYVITTYEGVHNHEAPSVVYYNHTPLVVSCGWTLQPPHSS